MATSQDKNNTDNEKQQKEETQQPTSSLTEMSEPMSGIKKAEQSAQTALEVALLQSNKWFPYLILFRELFIDGTPMAILTLALLRIATFAEHVIWGDLPCCESPLFKKLVDVYQGNLDLASSAFQVCLQATWDADGNKVQKYSGEECLDGVFCRACEMSNKATNENEKGALTAYIFVLLLIPLPYMVLVLRYWFAYKKSRGADRQAEPTLGDLYDNEIYWFAPSIGLFGNSKAFNFQLYLFAMTFFGFVVCMACASSLEPQSTYLFLKVYRDESPQKAFFKHTWFHFLIAFNSIFALLYRSPALFVMEKDPNMINEDNNEQQRQHQRTRAALHRLPLKDLKQQSIWKYLYQPSGILLVSLELMGLLLVKSNKMDESQGGGGDVTNTPEEENCRDSNNNNKDDKRASANWPRMQNNTLTASLILGGNV